MKKNLKNYPCSVVLAVVIGLAIMPGATSRVYAGNTVPGVLPPSGRAFGMTYGEWSARWWQWILSLPVDHNPISDTTACENGANGQLGPVWFLVNLPPSVNHTCTVPVGKSFFIPIVTVECSTLEIGTPFYGTYEAELRDCATGFPLTNLSVSIDEVAITDVARYLATSPLFNFTVPPDNIIGVDPGAGQSVANGYYLLLPSLKPGLHTISGTATVTIGSSDFTLDFKQNLNVVSP